MRGVEESLGLEAWGLNPKPEILSPKSRILHPLNPKPYLGLGPGGRAQFRKLVQGFDGLAAQG